MQKLQIAKSGHKNQIWALWHFFRESLCYKWCIAVQLSKIEQEWAISQKILSQDWSLTSPQVGQAWLFHVLSFWQIITRNCKRFLDISFMLGTWENAFPHFWQCFKHRYLYLKTNIFHKTMNFGLCSFKCPRKRFFTWNEWFLREIKDFPTR